MVVPVDREERLVAGEPVITGVGLAVQLDDDLRDEMIAAMRDAVGTMLDRGVVDDARLEKRVQGIAASYIYRGKRQRPKIQPIIVHVSLGQ